jgi:adenine deaminase
MKVVEGQITSEALKENLNVESGCIVPDTSRDILKAIVVERYGHTPPNIGKGFVTGFNLQSGAIATSVSADTHHLTAIGMNDVDMAIALNSVIDLQGGTVIIRKGRVIAQLITRVPVGGFISTEGFDKVAAGLRLLNAAAKELGCNLSSPFMALSFLGNPSLPELKLSDKGLMQMSERIIPLETT